MKMKNIIEKLYRIQILPAFIQKSLYRRIAVLVILFTASLIYVLFYIVENSYTEHDTLYDAHEMYSYANWVNSWGSPPDTLQIESLLSNLNMSISIYKDGEIYFNTFQKLLDINEFEHYNDSEMMNQVHGIKYPVDIVFFGAINDNIITAVQNNNYDYYFTVNSNYPTESLNYIPPIVMTVGFMLILFISIVFYLIPIGKMKNRIKDLENGDLESKIDIYGTDELADLSISINDLIKQIKFLVNQKHQLLLEVSHELRSPLARMSLLLEMLPQHKNNHKIKTEVIHLENMISNLLLSDKLSIPYTELNTQSISIEKIISKTLELLPTDIDKIEIQENLPEIFIAIDVTKFAVALRNLIENALKYGKNQAYISYQKNKEYILIQVSDNGDGISEEDIDKIMEPFYRSAKISDTIRGFGLGLTITKKIINAHKGFLTVSNSRDKGAIFTIQLPQ